MTIKNLRAHEPSQFTNDGRFANGHLTTNEPQPMFVQYNEPVNSICPRYPTSMYGLPADLIGLRNPHQPSSVKSGAFIISSQSMIPVVCGEPTSQLTKPLVSMNNSCQPSVPVGMGNHPGSNLDAHYFLTNVNATSTNAAPLFTTSSEMNVQNNVIVQSAEFGSLSPKLTHTNQSPPKVSSGNDVQDENLKLPQTFSGSAVSSLFTDSSAGHSSVNTTTNTTAIGSRNADSSNGSPCLPINNYSQPTTNGMPQQEHIGLPNSAHGTHSRQSSSLYHYMSPNDVNKEELQDLDVLISAMVTEQGGVLRLKESGVALYIPPGAVRPNMQERVYLAVCRDDRQRPVLRDTQTLLSPVVQFGPASAHLLTHMIVALPHCAELGDGCWFIRLLAMSSKAEAEQLERIKIENLMDNSALYATTNIMKVEEGDAIHVDINEELNQWQELFSIGFKASGISWSESSEGVVCHLSHRTAHVIIRHPQRFCLVGESAGQVLVQRQKSIPMDPAAKHQVFNHTPAIKALRLAAFSGRLTPTMDYNIRVYVLPDTQDALQHVLHVERQSDGHLVDATNTFRFQDNGAGMFFQIGELSFGWRSRLHAKTQEIPFRHIWSGTQMSTLHCAFSLEHVDLTQMSVSCQIVVFQGANQSYSETLHISSDAITASEQLLKCTHSLEVSCYRTVYLQKCTLAKNCV
ncbi:netrin receptor unc-5 [Paragonimus westermani]|uniref:Netrin receptor UNC5 n=1 Tax=Paragonimus westermani TaxID=34504 RepID=A0A5J4N834_9TREM|nr:netrin receptor unc-5 [Paragonimus westermani]